MTRADAIEIAKLLQTLINIAQVDIILNTFVAALRDKSIQHANGIHYLHGNFNIVGTVSGRMSSNSPNMMNIPSTGNEYAKDIKTCFRAPPGWIMCGADFTSLEDKISALTTKDPNKLKVYEEGFDGHCLRAYSYYKDKIPENLVTAEEINSIAKNYESLRQDSKNPTFALTYQGTWHTLVNNIGIPEEQAKEIERKYHELYKVSDDWVQAKIAGAANDGYVTVAFGLRVRTPILAQTILGNRKTPYEAKAEGRTAGNALGQSYGQLNNRAAIAYQERTLKSKYAEDIRPICHIHDSQYFLVQDDVHTMHWHNTGLIECMEWDGLSEIQHPTVKLGGQLEVYYPNWAKKIKIPNGASKKEILSLCRNP